MTTYLFNFATAEMTLDAMMTEQKKVETALSDLDSEVRTSLNEWEDTAKNAYVSAQAEWTQRAQNMPMNLMAARRGLGEMAEEYKRTESLGAKNWGSFSPR